MGLSKRVCEFIRISKILLPCIILTVIGAIVIGFILFKSNKIQSPSLKPKVIVTPTKILPKTNPFETKTNPFKDIKTNPFR